MTTRSDRRPRSLEELRRAFHASLCTELFGQRLSNGRPLYKVVRGTRRPVMSNADGGDDVSVTLAEGISEAIGPARCERPPSGTGAGSVFERLVVQFLSDALEQLRQSAPSGLRLLRNRPISDFAQYEHLDDVQRLIKSDRELRSALGRDYVVTPDIVIARDPPEHSALGDDFMHADLVKHSIFYGGALVTRPFLHASVSCKWTIRSDRVQNTRTEALNLVRNRKGRVPHVVAVTFEPQPGRLESIAVGTGDIDCVYHGALHELLEVSAQAAERYGRPFDSAHEQLLVMVEGRRLADIAALPVDLLA